MEEDYYYTPEEIAEKFRVTPQAVYNWVRRGQLRGVYIGTTLRVPASALNEFLVPSDEKPRKKRGNKRNPQDTH